MSVSHNSKLKLIECPRDAMQGWKAWIPTAQKISYINSLLKAGFDTIDFGSFVSEKAIPQMKDTAMVLEALELEGSNTKLLAIVANTRGGLTASAHSQISYIGFPFSISEQFQQRNTNSSIDKAKETVHELQEICLQSGKVLVIYLSMGFGNPYGDIYNEDIVFEWVNYFKKMDVRVISIADTVGMATPKQIRSVCNHLIPAYDDIEIGLHLHSTPGKQKEKILAALAGGCTRFDGALKGIGGCPMADDELVGNINMEQMIATMESENFVTGIDKPALFHSLNIASTIFHS